MASYEAQFEAMMANVTAPPLSLHEFRLFVAHDPVARNALAFCEWHQRYRTVYFDRVAVAPTVLTATSSRPGIPSDFMPTVRRRVACVPGRGCVESKSSRSVSFSAPHVARQWQTESMLGKMYTLKSHSFSGLSEGMVDSAFHTASSASESSTDGLGAKHPWQLVEPATAWPTASQRLGRRRTLPASSSIYEPDSDALRQEGNREAIQSLLIFECWARFLDASAREHVTIPEAERLYLTERLPLNITHLPQPLLCRSDMLASQITASNGLDAPAGDDGNKGAPIVRHVVPSRSLQFQPHEQLKQNIISHISKQGLCAPCPPTQPDHDGLIAGLRRISTMPALKHNCVESKAISQTGLSASSHLALRPAHLIDVDRLQRLHHTLRPRPPFVAASGSIGYHQPYGYRPVPPHISRLIIPSNVPPALFDTVAKISADYLLQHYFDDFSRQARYNLTVREQRVVFVVAMVQLALGVGAAVILIVVAVHRAWRTLTLPLLWGSAICLGAAWTRVSFWRWWRRLRPTLLMHAFAYPRDTESQIQADGLRGQDLDTIRWLTGTLYPSPQLGLAGTLNWNTCGSLHYKLAPLGSYVSGTLRSAELVGTSSAQTLWSLLSDLAAGTGVLGRLVRFMLRKHSSGDQWQINLGSRWIRVLDPSVLADQCQSVGHQLAILIFVCSAIAAVLFLIF
ncbi:hypothetical protein IWW52_004468 [Coemansia sp. RSA 2704]|nr:hypothetical protein IWW52_004468 [Coemansia sp. RSA 2704]